MDFPIGELLDEGACYDWLVRLIHPAGLTCPRCGSDDLRVHRRTRAPVLDYRCPRCERVFNALTRTAFHKVQYRPARIVLILRGIAQGTPTARLARELGVNRPHLLAVRHRLQGNALAHRDASALGDDHVEADEMYQNAGEKRRRHAEASDPPRRRGNRAAGHGTWESDRPPVVGVSGRVRLSVERRSGAAQLIPAVRRSARRGGVDRRVGGVRPPAMGRLRPCDGQPLGV